MALHRRNEGAPAHHAHRHHDRHCPLWQTSSPKKREEGSKMEKKIYAGVLPYAFDPEGRIVYLVGREKPSKKETISSKWSDFGGSPEADDLSDEDWAAREAYEETMAVLGSRDDIRTLIEVNRHHRFKQRGVVVFPVHITYDPILPKRFGDTYNYMKEAMHDFGYNRRKGYFEKTAIAWVTRDDIESYPEDYRPPFIRTFARLVAEHPILSRMG